MLDTRTYILVKKQKCNFFSIDIENEIGLIYLNDFLVNADIYEIKQNINKSFVVTENMSFILKKTKNKKRHMYTHM